ncbi:glycosyltransferase family 2 protein [Desulfuromonas sp. DDH964]|uniref:glycosyltransferase family 2 protein n=1 Tax=Desulfuromonas sp. DDH964 TaxID=1823759 RepID=UPI000834D32C|nr:glycosyltransferase family 2 protein [Desulfuromonas sp. DDH964]
MVIVSWNGRHYLEQCLSALGAQIFQNFSVILVDNGSTDGTIDFVRMHFPEVQIIPLEWNGGFAGPNNLGIQRALLEPGIQFIVTLNNDTQPEPDYLAELVACANRHPEAGSIQPKVNNFFTPELIDSTGILIAPNLSAVNRGLKEPDRGQYQREEEIFGSSASAALYTRKALETVALKGKAGTEFFDADYFAYYEDVDLALRLRLAGFVSYYAPAARVWHVHSATGKNYSPLKAFYIHRNQYLNILKNLPAMPMLHAFLLMPGLYWRSLLGSRKGEGAAGQLAKSARNDNQSLYWIVVRGWFQVLRMLPGVLRKRAQVQAKKVVGRKDIAEWFKRFGVDLDRVVAG